MNGSVVKVEEVTKRFAGHTAVERLSLEVPGGGIFGLLGPNGAGKSTTIRMIMNIITPDEGRISVLGGISASRDLSSRIGYLPRSEEHTSELQSQSNLVCRLLLEKKNN